MVQGWLEVVLLEVLAPWLAQVQEVAQRSLHLVLDVDVGLPVMTPPAALAVPR